MMKKKPAPILVLSGNHLVRDMVFVAAAGRTALTSSGQVLESR
ncbi:hypothetical protein AB8880_09550 [Alphaproteobacteria bacterium LSUCC0684]